MGQEKLRKAGLSRLRTPMKTAVTTVIMEIEVTTYGDVDGETGLPKVLRREVKKIGAVEADIPKPVRDWAIEALKGQ